MISLPCNHCEEIVADNDQTHWFEGDRGNGYGHLGLCCDCFDLSCGITLEQLNAERLGKGELPITKPWKTNAE